MGQSVLDLSSVNANKDVKQQLMTAIRRGQKDQTLRIIQFYNRSFSDAQLMEVVTCVVYLRNKDTLLMLLKHNTRCNCVFRSKFHLQTWKDSLRLESNQIKADGGDVFWIFDTLYKDGQNSLAMLVAAAFPEKTLINQKTWPEVIPTIDSSIRFLTSFAAAHDVISRLHKLTREPRLTSLKLWCVKNCHANIAFYLAVITKDWRLVKTMARTQASCYVDPRLLYKCIEFISNYRGSDSTRGYFAVVEVLEKYPLNKASVQFVPHYPRGPYCRYGLWKVARACKDLGLLDWALLLTSDLAYIKKHYKNCQNQHVLNHIFKTIDCFKYGEWEFAIELISRCDIGTRGNVLLEVFQQGSIGMAKEMMSRIDPSAITICGYSTLLAEAVNCEARNRRDTKCQLVRLCIASGLSTFQRSLTFPWDFRLFFPTAQIPKLRILKLLVESGTFTHRILHELCGEVQSMLSGQASEEEKKCCRYIQEAAATPCSLQHLARLTISHSIGYQPGRSDRIQALPLPNNLKPYLRFTNVLEADTQFHKKSEDREK